VTATNAGPQVGNLTGDHMWVEHAQCVSLDQRVQIKCKFVSWTSLYAMQPLLHRLLLDAKVCS